MAADTILQSPLFTKVFWPFLLVWLVVFAILEKTKVLGDSNKQVNSLVSLMVALIFVASTYSVDVVENLVLFMVVSLVVLLVFLLISGFLVNDPDKMKFNSNGAKWTVIGLSAVAVIIATFWATGSGWEFYDFLFDSSWSEAFWTNFIFGVIIIVSLFTIIKSGNSS